MRKMANFAGRSQDQRIMLKKIIIDNFKSIRHCETEFGRINLLIGENGAGKSNLISFIELAQTGGHRMRNYVLTHLGMGRLLHGGIKNSKVISGTLIFEGEGDGEYYCDEAETDSAYSISIGTAIDGTTPVVIEEAQYCDIPKGEPYEKGDKRLLGGIEEQNRMTEQKLRTQREVAPGIYTDVRTVHFVRVPIHSISIYHFQDTGNMSAIRGKANIDDNKVLKKDGENLASMLYLISRTEPRAFKMIEMMMRRVAPYFRCFDLQPDRMNPRLISIEWKENDSDIYLDSTSFSDGTIRFLALCVALMQPNRPKTIIIDEPELGLHPAAISIAAALIKKASADSQIIAATQSADFVSEFSLDQIIVAERKDGSTTFTHLSEDDFKVWLDEYSAGELWKKNLIGGRP